MASNILLSNPQDHVARQQGARLAAICQQDNCINYWQPRRLPKYRGTDLTQATSLDHGREAHTSFDKIVPVHSAQLISCNTSGMHGVHHKPGNHRAHQSPKTLDRKPFSGVPAAAYLVEVNLASLRPRTRGSSVSVMPEAIKAPRTNAAGSGAPHSWFSSLSLSCLLQY